MSITLQRTLHEDGVKTELNIIMVQSLPPTPPPGRDGNIK